MPSDRSHAQLPPGVPGIGDHALLSDCHASALVTRDGSVDWACFPRFDAPSVFARILDLERGGTFRLAPSEPVRARSRAYVEDTLVLVTRLRTAHGELELTDCMPVVLAAGAGPPQPVAHHAILRRVRCLSGRVTARLVMTPRFEYAALLPRIRLTSARTAEVVGGADALWVTASRPLGQATDRLGAEWRLQAGEEVWVEAAWSSSHEERPASSHPSPAVLAQRLEETLAFWRRWSSELSYTGAHAAQVRRSALTLKALTYAPTGAVIAAPTTSLPEEPGGSRNWDYRYTWVRDSVLTLISLLVVGVRHEADGFRRWLRRTSAGRPEDLQIMYGIAGERSLPERELLHLAGHGGARPVRVGNGAVKQRQLDVPGELIEASWLYAASGGGVTRTNWAMLSGLADAIARGWREPDQGLWEVRSPPRHFVHSKLLCWVALDRALRLARLTRLPAPVGRWAHERAAIARWLLEEGARPGWFTQAAGSTSPDAAVLLVPATGFLPARHPLVERTVERLRAELGHGGLLHRYRSEDGLPGGEGAFLLCSCWLADVLAHQGRREEAEAVLEELLSLANDVGLWAEEAHPVTRAPLGNFPQAFTHMGFISSCAQLTALREGRLPLADADASVVFSEFALLRR